MNTNRPKSPWNGLRNQLQRLSKERQMSVEILHADPGHQRDQPIGWAYAKSFPQEVSIRRWTYQVDKRVTNPICSDTMFLEELLLKRKDHDGAINILLEGLDPSFAPRPQLRHDVVENRDVLVMGLGRQLEIEPREVDENDSIGRPLPDLAVQGAQALAKFQN